MKRTSKCKLKNKVVQKGRIITVKKAREKITETKANKITVGCCTLIRAQKTAHNTIVGPKLVMLKEGNKVKSLLK